MWRWAAHCSWSLGLPLIEYWYCIIEEYRQFSGKLLNTSPFSNYRAARGQVFFIYLNKKNILNAEAAIRMQLSSIKPVPKETGKSESNILLTVCLT